MDDIRCPDCDWPLGGHCELAGCPWLRCEYCGGQGLPWKRWLRGFKLEKKGS